VVAVFECVGGIGRGTEMYGDFIKILTPARVSATGSCAVNGVATTLIVENRRKVFFF